VLADRLYIAFLPLYALGLMGMPAACSITTLPAGNRGRVVAAIGAVIIPLGDRRKVIQLVRLASGNREQLKVTRRFMERPHA